MFEFNTKDVNEAVKEETEETSHTVSQTCSLIDLNDSTANSSPPSNSATNGCDIPNQDEVKLEMDSQTPTVHEVLDVTIKSEIQDSDKDENKEICNAVSEHDLSSVPSSEIEMEKQLKIKVTKTKKNGKQKQSSRNLEKKIKLAPKKPRHKKYEKPSDQVLKVYKCALCPKVFKRSSHYNVHQRTHNPLTTKPFSCEDCKNTFHYHCQLRDHARIHTGERPFKCHSCSKAFTRKACLVQHMVTHMDSLPFQCDICRKRFARKYNLAKHVQSHSGERPYRCLNCSRRFKCKQSLERHNRVHELNIYSCTICQESFDSKRRLTRHKINEHVSYRPFTCQICHKPFIFKSQLTYHIKEHNLERPYSCVKCNKSYFKKGHLLLHLKQYCGDFIPVSKVKMEVVA
uniref:C2H2-type domain-containing protein n=1 Tax=Cuerna arida TaxID=1464854 RepID=A0A1B6G6V3_9HEMI